MSPFVVPPAAAIASGGSLAYEEYRGDLSAASVLADDALRQARSNGDPVPLAEALISRAVIALLQGDVQSALVSLDDPAVVDAARADTRYRATALATLAHSWNANLFPDRSGAGGVELTSRVARLRDALERMAHLGPQLRRQVQDVRIGQEAQLVSLLVGLQAVRAIVADGANTAVEGVARDSARNAADDVRWLRDEVARGKGEPRLVAYLERLLAEYVRLAADADSEPLAIARAAYRSAGDVVGEGACALLAGDWLASSVGSPAVWNTAVRESASEGSDLAWTTEEREFDAAGCDVVGARAAYDEAEALFQQGGAPRGLAAVSLRRVYLALLSDDGESAARHVTDARTGFERAGDHQGAWLARVQQALVRIWNGAIVEDRDTPRDAGTWGATEGSFSYALGLGLFAGRMARYWMLRRGDYVRASAAYRFAEALFEGLGALENRVQSVVDQAYVYRVIGERNEAVTRLEQALDLRRQRESPTPAGIGTAERERLVAHALYALALDAKDPDRMERAADRLLAVRDRGGFADSGIESSIAGWAVHELIDSTRQQAAVLVPAYRSERAREEGDDAKARALFASAIDATHVMAEDQRDLFQAIVLAHARDYSGAAAAYRQRMEHQRRALDGLTGPLLEVMKRLAPEGVGRQEAERYAQRQHEEAALFLTRVKAYDDALAEWEALERAAGPEWWMRDARPWETVGDYGEACEGTNALERALSLFDKGIKELERRRGMLTRDELKTALAGGKGAQWLYFQAARASARVHERARANGDAVGQTRAANQLFDYAERGKARGLLDLIAASVTVAGDRSETPLVAEWRRLGSELTVRRGLLARVQERQPGDDRELAIRKLEAEIALAESEVANVEQRLAHEDPAFYRAVNPQVDVVGLDDVSRRLAPGTVLLQYQFLGDDLLAWAITPSGMVGLHHVPVDARALSRQIKQFHHACASAAADWAPQAEALASTFIAPFDDIIADSSRILIVPYAAAHELPFHVLPWRGTPLGLARTTSYLPSASFLQYVRGDVAVSQRRVLAIGNPTGAVVHDPLTRQARELGDLPNASVEAAYVGSLLSDESVVLRERDATKAAVQPQLGRFPVLHFATHATLSADAPLLSAIALAEGDEITLYELMSARLDAEIAVLSACNTARGESTRGDDILGLTRGLLAAGARSALVTLWPVRDDTTTLLVARFYERLRAGAVPAAAVQDAETYVRELTSSRMRADLTRIRSAAKTVVPPAGLARAARATTVAVARGDATEPGNAEVPSASSTVEGRFDHPYFWAPFILIG